MLSPEIDQCPDGEIGRLRRLKICCSQGRAGSNPAPGTSGFRSNKAVEDRHILTGRHGHVPLITSLANHPYRSARLPEQLPDLLRAVRELVARVAVDLN